MENNLVNLKPKINKKPAALLPNYFKKIGFFVIILAFIPAISKKIFDIEMLEAQKVVLKILTINILILGLFFLAWSRDKFEDEMTVALRLKAVAFAFAFAVVSVIIMPVFDLLFQDAIQESTGQHVVMGMLLMYLIVYYLQKIGR